MTRKEKILSNIQQGNQTGLEFGPLTSPIVTRDKGFIRYVDHATTEELQKKCGLWGTVDVSKIVDVDYVWANEKLKELTNQDCPFDYVIASHVVEHVPDFIGWFKEIRSVLKTGGILSLAIPDKRFTFDCHRQLTKPADILEAYLLQSKKPSVRQIFDYKSEYVNRNKGFTWSLKEKTIPEHSISESWDITQNAFRNNNYEDVHCWVFTDLSFLDLIKTLVELDLFDFKIANFFDRTGIEFFVGLEAMDSNIDPTKRINVQLESIKTVQTKISRPFRQSIHDFSSTKVVSILRYIKKKLVFK
ncbi:MAG: class I SAM-dependent methyltransferase [Ignavibacteriaceae bacterium]|nr:class I SAM-dependent methyltransferase [Ignavibacteriaceae bacterium]MCW9065800.1 class I SAM-dependent methyltransferase [Ignavibacteriaceae bacterium]